MSSVLVPSPSQLPPMPATLPQTQADWAQFVAVMQAWQLAIQPSLPAGLDKISTTTAAPITGAYTVQASDTGTVLQGSTGANFTLPQLPAGTYLRVNVYGGAVVGFTAGSGVTLYNANATPISATSMAAEGSAIIEILYVTPTAVNLWGIGLGANTASGAEPTGMLMPATVFQGWQAGFTSIAATPGSANSFLNGIGINAEWSGSGYATGGDGSNNGAMLFMSNTGGSGGIYVIPSTGGSSQTGVAVPAPSVGVAASGVAIPRQQTSTITGSATLAAGVAGTLQVYNGTAAITLTVPMAAIPSIGNYVDIINLSNGAATYTVTITTTGFSGTHYTGSRSSGSITLYPCGWCRLYNLTGTVAFGVLSNGPST